MAVCREFLLKVSTSLNGNGVVTSVLHLSNECLNLPVTSFSTVLRRPHGMGVNPDCSISVTLEDMVLISLNIGPVQPSPQPTTPFRNFTDNDDYY